MMTPGEIPSLILVGTVHGDPQGYDRARRLLRHLAPDLITVEVSQFSVRYRLRHQGRWLRLLQQALAELPSGAGRHLAIRRLAAQVALPFEVKAARDYSRLRGVPWRPVDLGAPARRHLPRYEPELLHPANLRTLLTTDDGSLEEQVAAAYRRARGAYRQPPRRLFTQGSPETLRREKFLARRLQRLASRTHRVVHLGGWEHLVGWPDSPSLWQGLAALQPLRLLLDEVEGWQPEPGSGIP
jgi:hypothetical protein